MDTVAPDRPSIDTVSNDVGKIQGALVDGQTGDDATPPLAGRAEAGSTVSIYGNGSLLGQAVTGADGAWSFTPSTPLINGAHLFTVTSMDKAGNVSSVSTPHLTIVDTIAPDRPTIDAAYDDEGDMQGTLASGDDTDDRLPVFNGKAEAESTVVIRDNGVEIGRVIADAYGRWSHALVEPLSLGEHAFTLVAIDAAGNVSVPSSVFALTVVLEASVDPLVYVQEASGPVEASAMEAAGSLSLLSMLSDERACLFQEEVVPQASVHLPDAEVSLAYLQLEEQSELQPSWLLAAASGSIVTVCGSDAQAANGLVARAEDLLMSM
ncbi:MAG: Ig-like domain-containing protein [Stenotrophomonas sp.]